MRVVDGLRPAPLNSLAMVRDSGDAPLDLVEHGETITFKFRGT